MLPHCCLVARNGQIIWKTFVVRLRRWLQQENSFYILAHCWQCWLQLEKSTSKICNIFVSVCCNRKKNPLKFLWYCFSRWLALEKSYFRLYRLVNGVGCKQKKIHFKISPTVNNAVMQLEKIQVISVKYYCCSLDWNKKNPHRISSFYSNASCSGGKSISKM